MNATQLNISQEHVHKLLCTSDPDATLLYLYLQSGNAPETAAASLQLSPARLNCATALLRQLDLIPRNRPRMIVAGQRPNYSEADVQTVISTDQECVALRMDAEELLGKMLTVEELKILLGIVRYLGLAPDVVHLLICHCRERLRRKNSNRMPTLRSIEKEAYIWAERNIDTMEEAAVYIRQENLRASRIGQLMQILQIHGRTLTSSEERYANQWLDWGFDDQVIAMAYDRTCLNTGGLSWAYMNKILSRWQKEGLKTPEQVRSGDQATAAKNAPRQLDEDEKAALAAMMKEM